MVDLKRKLKTNYVIGVDEVGRGSLAGPVTVAAVAIPKKFSFPKFKNLKLKDSKKLTPLQREKWFDWVKENKIPYAVSSVSPKIIDKINISNAANLAATKAFQQLIAKSKLQRVKIYLDGGLFLNKLQTTNYKLQTKTIIRGDEKINTIKLASIVAKVIRDKKMKQFHKKYPQYGFLQNKGYGTKKHLNAIKKYGFCSIHRKSFLKPFIVKPVE